MVAEPDARQALEVIRAERLRRIAEAEAAERSRIEAAKIDIADWAESRYYIKETRRPVLMPRFQKGILRAMFRRDASGLRLFREGMYSTIQKSGKTTIAGCVGRWYGETQTHLGEIYCIANDFRQAKEREFKSIRDSMRLTPGSRKTGSEIVLPGTGRALASRIEFDKSGSTIDAISVDAAGEAGSARDLTLFTEFWGFRHSDAEEFWDEMGPIVTKPDSFRFVESYAGYSGDSILLERHYNLGKAGRQLTNREFAELSCREVDGERYEDMLYAFEETHGDEHAPVPIWVNEAAQMFMYWDEDEPEGTARRMPWQKGPVADAYYASEAAKNPRNYERVHRNKWTTSVGEFIPMESWDACKEELPPFLPENKEPCVLATDAATTHDCFAIVAVTRNPNRERDPAIRACKKYDPAKMGGTVDYSIPEAFLRCKIVGGCVAGHPLLPNKSGPDLRYGPGGSEDMLDRDRWPEGVCGACRDRIFVQPYNVLMVAYDPFQLEDMMQRLRRELGVRTKKFDQIKDRLIADHGLYTAVLERRLAHDGNPDLREHVEGAAAKIDTDAHKMRIVKKGPDKHVDLAVAASMGVREIMRLVLTAEG